jgi:predicted histidine transporter YuiF (NhaC family)
VSGSNFIAMVVMILILLFIVMSIGPLFSTA